MQIEDNLQEIVKLVGMDALSYSDRLTLETARSIREDFLQQNAFDGDDSYCELDKQLALMKLVFYFEEKAKDAIENGANIDEVTDIPVREAIGRFKSVPYASYKEEYNNIKERVNNELAALVDKED